MEYLPTFTPNMAQMLEHLGITPRPSGIWLPKGISQLSSAQNPALSRNMLVIHCLQGGASLAMLVGLNIFINQMCHMNTTDISNRI